MFLDRPQADTIVQVEPESRVIDLCGEARRQGKDGHTPDRQTGRQTAKKTSIETERVKVVQIPFLAVVVDLSVFDFIVLHKHFPYVRRTLLSPPLPPLGLAPSVCKFHKRNL